MPDGARIISVDDLDQLPAEIDPSEVAGLFGDATHIVIAGFPTEEDEANRLIDPVTVETIHTDCLLRADEVFAGQEPADAVHIDGVVEEFVYRRVRLEKHRTEVHAILELLPMEFRRRADGGEGGWSFIMAGKDRDGWLWTGLQRRMAQLLGLGQALGYVKCQVPRPLWSAFPGGVPYYEVIL